MKTVRLAVLCAALCLLTAGVILLTAGTAPARTSPHTPSPEAIEALNQKYGLEPPVSPPPSAPHVDVGWSYK